MRKQSNDNLENVLQSVAEHMSKKILSMKRAHKTMSSSEKVDPAIADRFKTCCSEVIMFLLWLGKLEELGTMGEVRVEVAEIDQDLRGGADTKQVERQIVSATVLSGSRRKLSLCELR